MFEPEHDADVTVMLPLEYGDGYRVEFASHISSRRVLVLSLHYLLQQCRVDAFHLDEHKRLCEAHIDNHNGSWQFSVETSLDTAYATAKARSLWRSSLNAAYDCAKNIDELTPSSGHDDGNNNVWFMPIGALSCLSNLQRLSSAVTVFAVDTNTYPSRDTTITTAIEPSLAALQEFVSSQNRGQCIMVPPSPDMTTTMASRFYVFGEEDVRFHRAFTVLLHVQQEKLSLALSVLNHPLTLRELPLQTLVMLLQYVSINLDSLSVLSALMQRIVSELLVGGATLSLRQHIEECLHNMKWKFMNRLLSSTKSGTNSHHQSIARLRTQILRLVSSGDDAGHEDQHAEA